MWNQLYASYKRPAERKCVCCAVERVHVERLAKEDETMKRMNSLFFFSRTFCFTSAGIFCRFFFHFSNFPFFSRLVFDAVRSVWVGLKASLRELTEKATQNEALETQLGSIAAEMEVYKAPSNVKKKSERENKIAAVATVAGKRRDAGSTRWHQAHCTHLPFG